MIYNGATVNFTRRGKGISKTFPVRMQKLRMQKKDYRFLYQRIADISNNTEESSGDLKKLSVDP